jgi:hypothetical protein
MLDPEIQEKRYFHKQERKRKKIAEAKERRKDMIENPEKIFKVKKFKAQKRLKKL